MHRLIPATQRSAWNETLALAGKADVTSLADYHLAYSLRVAGSSPLLWHFTEGGRHLVYPFLFTPVVLEGVATGHHDISSVYGYTGPLASNNDTAFVQAAWQAFDAYTKEQCVVAEFIRFSPFSRNEHLAHPQAEVVVNRNLAASLLPASEEEFAQSLGPKTRNMLRKATRAGLQSRELELPAYLPEFRALYAETMRRNSAPEFFLYDDAYWQHMLALAPNHLRLFGTFAGGNMVAAAMAVAHGRSGLYHLGASLVEHARLGAGNLSLYAMSCELLATGVRFLNMTGGRSVSGDDPLLLFKRSNANSLVPFYIGKRVVNVAAYNELVLKWQHHHGGPPDPGKVIFWRS